MNEKIKKNLLLLLSIAMVVCSVLVYAQPVSAYIEPECRSCGGPFDGGECYTVNIGGGSACLFTTSGACRNAGSC